MLLRYYPLDQLLQPHKFYHGNSAGLKKANWVNLFQASLGCHIYLTQYNWLQEQLRKFFKLHDIRIPAEACDAVMNCQIEAAALFVENLFMLLTGRRVQRLQNHQPELVDHENLPHFALPTTSDIIRRVANSPSKAQTIVESHNEYIKQLRAEYTETHAPSWQHPVHRFDEQNEQPEELEAHAHHHAHQHEHDDKEMMKRSLGGGGGGVGQTVPVVVRVHQIAS
ncbi:hypothetical protein HK097_002937 [Rhizophlyctis rosea]|uniref:Uncharacterized protein n=1 Tax=Rhizophlyctis rosea TaxID=64517 RepID=A0AAD5WXH6_9FUNG|nr:hypothetical protein HK097_002937 [Rhizophlyctis rosea]